MNTEAIFAAARVARHFDRSCIQPEAVLRRDFMLCASALETAIGVRLDLDVARFIESARLVTGPSVGAFPMFPIGEQP